MKSNLIIACFAILLTAINACKHEIPQPDVILPPNGNNNGGDCDQNIVYFEQQILPIFQSSCAIPGCHDEATQTDGIVLTSWQGVMNAGIQPGNPWEEDVMEAIAFPENPEDQMPPYPNAPLSQNQIDLITDWIIQGAQNNSCETAGCDTSNVSFSMGIWPIIENKCQGCHTGAGPMAGISLNNYDDVFAIASSGLLNGTINALPGYIAMPYNGAQLPQCQLDMIRIWIEDGAPNN